MYGAFLGFFLLLAMLLWLFAELVEFVLDAVAYAWRQFRLGSEDRLFDSRRAGRYPPVGNYVDSALLDRPLANRRRTAARYTN